jgi:hypothetical protein
MKKHKAIFYTLIIVVSLTVLSSCRKLAQSDFPDFKQVPTVNGFLVADSLLKVHISLASKLGTYGLNGFDHLQVQLCVEKVFTELFFAIG